HPSHVIRTKLGVHAQRVARQRFELGQCFDARVAAADEGEREQRAPPYRVGRGVGGLELCEDVVAQPDRIGEILEPDGVVDEARAFSGATSSPRCSRWCKRRSSSRAAYAPPNPPPSITTSYCVSVIALLTTGPAPYRRATTRSRQRCRRLRDDDSAAFVLQLAELCRGVTNDATRNDRSRGCRSPQSEKRRELAEIAAGLIEPDHLGLPVDALASDLDGAGFDDIYVIPVVSLPKQDLVLREGALDSPHFADRVRA